MSDKQPTDQQKKEEADRQQQEQQPKPLTDEQTYADVRPATEPRVTSRAETEEEAKKREEEEKKGGEKKDQPSQPTSVQASTKGDDKSKHS